MGKAKDYTGQKHGKLTFIRPTDKRTGNKSIGTGGGIIWEAIWEAICDCGKTTYLTPYRAISGVALSCGCMRNDNHRKHTALMSTARNVWRKYSDECDFETFYALSQLPCYYCGRAPHRTWNVGKCRKDCNSSEYQRTHGDFTYNGLDRVDSSKGHTADNVVPCCYTCNKAKSNLTFEEFLLHIRRIYEHTQAYFSNGKPQYIHSAFEVGVLQGNPAATL